MKSRNQDILEINLTELIKLVLRRLWLIILAGIVLSLVFYGYYRMKSVRLYTAEGSIYVNLYNYNYLGRDEPYLTGRGVEDVAILLNGPGILEKTAEILGDGTTAKTLGSKIRLDHDDKSQIISIKVTDQDPEKAIAIVDAAESAAQICLSREDGLVEIEIPETTEIVSVAASPSLKKGVFLSFFLGALIAGLAVICPFILKRPVMNPDDIEYSTGGECLADLSGKKDKTAVIRNLLGSIRFKYGEGSCILVADTESIGAAGMHDMLQSIIKEAESSGKKADLIETEKDLPPVNSLSDDQIEEMIRARSDGKDFLFVKTPSFKESYDAAIVGRMCDGIMITASKGKTGAKDLIFADNAAVRSGCEKIGVVLL